MPKKLTCIVCGWTWTPDVAYPAKCPSCQSRKHQGPDTPKLALEARTKAQ